MKGRGFTKLQKKVFTLVSQSNLAQQFYFTGDTALSVFHLHHRESKDLDFFSEKQFDNDPVIQLVTDISHKIGLGYNFTQRYDTRIIEFKKKEEIVLKIDFNHYPYKRVEQGKRWEGMEIDSLLDIERTDVKDFVDLYFLLKDHYTIWDLLYVVEEKFRMKSDLVMLASDFLKTEEFDFLPRMLVPLTNEELNTFFKKQAISIGRRITK